MSTFSSISRPSRGLTLTNSLLGDALSALPSQRWKHPWFTRATWLDRAQRWVATVVPGFVNAQTPIFRATIQEQQTLGNPWENNPLTGKPFFSSSVFDQTSGSQTAATRMVDLPLYLNPVISLDFYGIGFDGDPSAGVPQFFQNLGAAKLPAGQSADTATPPPNLRLLRACDLWLVQPRAALTSSVELQDGPVTGQSNVTQTLGIRSPAPGEVLRLSQGFYRPIDLTAGIDPLSFDYEEPAFDQVRISTVYLLSPPNTPVGSTPDATWIPYVRHYLFWNLQWAQPEFRQLTDDPGTPLIPPLAGGAAQLIINFLTASLNDTTAQALNILTAHSLAGHFWTATGGGSDATFAALATAQAAQTKTGPDRKANAAARLAALQAQQRAQQLDPDFPYHAEPFNTSLLVA